MAEGVEVVSVPSLISDLCKLALGQPCRASLVQPKYTYSEKLKILKAKAWITMLGQLRGPLCIKPPPSSTSCLSEIDRIYAYSYVLRTKHQFDNAHQLETLVESLMKGQGSASTKKAVLQLLLLLADSQETSSKSVIGYQLKTPVAAVGSEVVPVLPNGPLEYGDTRVHTVNMWYMHFPSHIFDQPGLDTSLQQTDNKPNLTEIFNSPPGLHLPDLFRATGCLGDSYEHATYKSLYGALVHSTATSVDVQLSLPDLSILDTPPEIRIPSFTMRTKDGCDELLSSPSSGYVSPTDSGLGSTELDGTTSDTDIWQKALQYEPSKHRLWENLGRLPGPTELPYVTEAGGKALDYMWAIYISQLRLINPDIQLPPRRLVDMNKLVTDVINLLLGLPSACFILDKTSDEFHICPGLYLSGMTSEALAEACQSAVECGASYRRLAAFSQSVVMNSFYQGGLIFQAFTSAVAKYLQYYSAFILSVPTGKTLIEVNACLHRVYKQMRFLAELCHCTVPVGDADALSETFPTGVQLLSYLYEHTLEVTGSDLYPVMLSLFTSSCVPYLVFVQDWVFHGICQDIYQEFMIKVNDDYLRYKDKHYWTKGYVMISDNQSTAVPLFLSHLTNEIFVCGKTVNLMKLIAPEHFLFNIDIEIPRVVITFDEEEAEANKINCEKYLSRMQQIARRETLSRQQMIQRAEQAKQDLIAQASKVAVEELARIQALTQQRKEKEDIRKRKLFTELKQQMEADLERRSAEHLKNKEEDKARIRDANMKQELAVKVDKELEKQAREELVEYYAKLSGDAALREQRALWKVRRGQLDATRREFLLREQAQLEAEMEKLKHQKAMVEPNSEKKPPSSLDIARWTEDTPDATQQQGGTEALPHWAREGLETAAPGFEVNVTEDLPVWAKRALENETGEPADSGADSKSVQGETSKQDIQESSTAGREKRHPSHSSVGDIMRSEPSCKVELEGIRHVVVQQAEKPKNSHPNASTIQELMYSEPVHKDDVNKLNLAPRTDNGIINGESCELQHDKKENVSDDLDGIGRGSCDSSGTKPEVVDFDDNTSHHTVALTAKSQIRLMDDRHATTESQQQDVRPSIHMQQDVDMLTETTSDPVKVSTRQISGRHVTDQSEESVPKCHTAMSKTMSATGESQEVVVRSHLKSIENKHSSSESQPTESKLCIKYNYNRNVSKQSLAEEVKVKPRSMFGHVSDLSKGEFVIAAPKLKCDINKHPSIESDYKSFQVKTHRRKKVVGYGVDQCSEEVLYHTRVLADPAHHPSAESTDRNWDKERLEQFKKINFKGHASDSSVQRLLYGQNHIQEQTEDNEDLTLEPETLDLITTTQLEQYCDKFNFDCTPEVGLMTLRDYPVYSSLGDFGISKKQNISAFSHVPLPALLKQSITAPLIAQISLVNESVVNYFTTVLDLDGHLEKLRQFLLMEDGEFGERLAGLLFEKLSQSPRLQEVFNPTFLNDVLNQAVTSSMHRDNKYTDNISFRLRFLPKVLKPNAPDALDCLELTYRVPWPVNIVITENGIKKYGRVFTFMLQLKQVIWVLNDVWNQLKRDDLINRASSGYQFRQLQIYRHEMQYFVKVLQGYLSNQIIHVSWLELREALSNNVHNLDDLHNYHDNYLNKCLSRCLLNKKAEKVMKLIQEIFCLILKFRIQLLSSSWQRDATTGDVRHPAFKHLQATYNAFRNYSRFLFKVIHILAIKGYHPHLQDLLLRLNFNMYYNSEIV